MHKLTIASIVAALALTPTAVAHLAGLPFTLVDVRRAMSGPNEHVGLTIQARSSAVRLETWAAVPDTAHRVTVERVALSRLTRVRRQWCLWLEIREPPPGVFGAAVGNYRYLTIEVERRLVGSRVPTRWVVVDSRGKKLAASAGSNAASCARALGLGARR